MKKRVSPSKKKPSKAELTRQVRLARVRAERRQEPDGLELVAERMEDHEARIVRLERELVKIAEMIAADMIARERRAVEGQAGDVGPVT